MTWIYRFLKLVLQVAFMSLLSFFGDWLVSVAHIQIPGSIVGLVLLFVLLQMKIVKTEWLDLGATWLISELLLFYVPSAVGIVQYGHVMALDGVRLVVVIAISTALVMVSTGLLADRITKTKQRRTGKAV